jgi:tRNA(fMet)-specific endonuclease VapC
MTTSGARVALDTDVAIAILNEARDAWERVQEFDEIYLPVPAVGELRFGALNSGRPEKNLDKIDFFLTKCHILDVRLSTTVAYARVRLGLKKRGRPIPENDMWIAALCVEHGVPLATYDEHFDEVDGLTLAGFRSPG